MHTAQILRCYGCGIRQPVATAPIQSLAWEPPYAMGAALKKTNKKMQGISVCYKFSFFVSHL